MNNRTLCQRCVFSRLVTFWVRLVGIGPGQGIFREQGCLSTVGAVRLLIPLPDATHHLERQQRLGGVVQIRLVNPYSPIDPLRQPC